MPDYRAIPIISQLLCNGGVATHSRLSAFADDRGVTGITRAREPCHLRKRAFEARLHEKEERPTVDEGARGFRELFRAATGVGWGAVPIKKDVLRSRRQIMLRRLYLRPPSYVSL